MARTYNNVTPEFRRTVVDYAREFTPRAAMERFDVAQTSVYRWLNEEWDPHSLKSHALNARIAMLEAENARLKARLDAVRKALD